MRQDQIDLRISVICRQDSGGLSSCSLAIASKGQESTTRSLSKGTF